jgi:hypothetical protein
MLHRDVRRIGLVEDINVLSHILWLYHGHCPREEALLTIRVQVCILDAPSWDGLENDALEPHRLRREVLYVDLKEDLCAFFGR